jgi:WD40 repeat protein
MNVLENAMDDACNVVAVYAAKPIIEIQRLDYLINLSNLVDRAATKGAKGELLMKAHAAEIICAFAISQDKMFWIGGSITGVLYVWDAKSGELRRFWTAHVKKITSIVVSSCGKFIISASEDSMISVWKLGDATKLSEDNILPFVQFKEHVLAVKKLVQSSAGFLIASISLDRTIRLWDIALKKQVAMYKLPGAVFAQAIAFDSSETELFIGASDGEIYLINLYSSSSESAPERLFSAHKSGISDISFDWAGGIMYTCGDDGYVKGWKRTSNSNNQYEFSLAKSAKISSTASNNSSQISSSLKSIKLIRIHSGESRPTSTSSSQFPQKLEKYVSSSSSSQYQQQSEDPSSQQQQQNTKSFLLGDTSKSSKSKSLAWDIELVVPNKKQKTVS